MEVTAKRLLTLLPPYNDQWRVVHNKQYVSHIINDILYSHELFTGYYDRFASLFYRGSVPAICNGLYDFCKRSIRYREETKELQTTALPTGILTRGYGDCKHYALFCAGVIDALNRLYGLNIDWWYYFAAYKKDAKEPYHVFVGVQYGSEEIWIDPTPGAGRQTPTLLLKRYANG